MKNYKTVDGNEACSINSYLFTEIAAIYPITPSSTMAEKIDSMGAEGKLNIFNDKVKVVEMQSEAGAIGMVHGSLLAGALSSTYTASQGLLLMIPNMYKIAGELLPAVIHVASRSLATHALSIMGDHQDIYATRQTGFAIISSSSVQEAHDFSAISHLSAIKSSVPFLHFFDGFRTSHEIQRIEMLDEDELKKLVDYDKINEFRKRSLNPNNIVTKGTSQSDDIYFQITEARNKEYENVIDEVVYYMDKISNLTGREYKPFTYYGSENPDKVIIAMGSVCETIKETIDTLNSNGYNVGLVNVHLFRPFSKKHLLSVIKPSVKSIAVLDRTKEFGSSGEPLFQDVVTAFNNSSNKPKIYGGRYGLSSKDTNPYHIKAVYDYLENPINETFTIGIDDDVTNLSLKVDSNFEFKNKALEFLIYGYGSDGMIGSSKSILKLVGEKLNNFVQGYFQYDSKKSGGITKSHLRFSNELIRSTYYVNNPYLVVCSKDSYLPKFDMLDGIKDNGIFLINTSYDKTELLTKLKPSMIKIIKEKNIKVYTVNAFSLSRKLGLKDKISTIMTACILSITKLVSYDVVIDSLKSIVYEMFKYKGDEVINKNYEAIDKAVSYLEEVSFDDVETNNTPELMYSNIIEQMNDLKGNQIPVSAFLHMKDGTFTGGNTKYEKRHISDYTPYWISENCIQCNQCSFVCPHAVIRPFLLDDSEVINADINLKEKILNPIGANLSNYKYAIGVSYQDCTGCGLCVNVCPGKKGEKALDLRLTNKDVTYSTSNNYLFNNVTNKDTGIVNSVKTSQFKKPKFEFHGACQGCGETSYLKILTQLFGDNLIIANATGCSSIYGGSAPSMPYSIPWVNSLFEDNAEVSYGIYKGNAIVRDRIKTLMTKTIDKTSEYNKELYNKYIENNNDSTISKEVYDKLNFDDVDNSIKELKDYIKKPVVFAVGGDGWAYDIGFSGIDHVLASNENINILILDTEVYSNTGGQASKSTRSGGVAEFALTGKNTNKKDFIRIALSYPNVYVGTICLNANKEQTIKVLLEAQNHEGPSVVIAYSPCIAHGIKGGLENSLSEQTLAVESGYFPLLRYNPKVGKIKLDQKEPDFDLYNKFLENELRYTLLDKLNKEQKTALLENNKNAAKARYEYYKKLSE